MKIEVTDFSILLISKFKQCRLYVLRENSVDVIPDLRPISPMANGWKDHSLL